jgi:hypothetical protein
VSCGCDSQNAMLPELDAMTPLRKVKMKIKADD